MFLLLTAVAWPAAATDPVDVSDDSFASKIRLLLLHYCSNCHADDNIKVDLELSVNSSLDDLRAQIPVWRMIRPMLDSLPVVIAGCAGGQLQSRQCWSDQDHEHRWMCRMSLSLMKRMGVHRDRFGDAVEPRDEV